MILVENELVSTAVGADVELVSDAAEVDEVPNVDSMFC